jgi:mono/diheme cytochrome c family protein
MGRVLYLANCQQCHGPEGRGDGPLAADLDVPPADFRDHVPYHEDDFFFNVITNGLGSIMPAWGDQLTEDERWHLINFLQAEFGIEAQQAGG